MQFVFSSEGAAKWEAGGRQNHTFRHCKEDCEADPIPTKLQLLLKVISEVTPFIYFVVNDSLKPGIFPDYIKIALVRKKMGA